MSEQDGWRHPGQALSAYADGELEPAEAREVEEHLRRCTECAREVALIESLGEVMRATEGRKGGSVWERVHRRIARPVGWILLAAGVAVLGTLATLQWFRAGTLSVEWLATTSVAVGVALVAVSIGWEQYKEWRGSPYRDVDR